MWFRTITRNKVVILSKIIRSRPPYTEYVATRWYRAPEIILQASNYNSPVDIFALGCIMAELFNKAPLFNGQNETD
jgi:serine/threonine protein kinase